MTLHQQISQLVGPIEKLYDEIQKCSAAFSIAARMPVDAYGYYTEELLKAVKEGLKWSNKGREDSFTSFGIYSENLMPCIIYVTKSGKNTPILVNDLTNRFNKIINQSSRFERDVFRSSGIFNKITTTRRYEHQYNSSNDMVNNITKSMDFAMSAILHNIGELHTCCHTIIDLINDEEYMRSINSGDVSISGGVQNA